MDPNKTNQIAADPSPDKEPEAYIRTLESDIDVLQRGGTPGFAPLKRAEPRPAERLVEASPIITETQATPSEKKDEPQPIPVPPKSEPNERVVPIETYSEDFRQRLKDTHASTATVIAAEQDAAPQTEAVAEAPARDARNLWYVLAGVLLLVAGSAGAYVAYTRYLVQVAPVAIAPSNAAPIFVDSSDQVAGTGRALAQSIMQSVAKQLSTNTVRQLTLASATSTNNIFLLLGAPIPGILTRNMNETGNMAGVVNANGTQSPFFILSVELYSATFSGMLSWEPTMQHDLNALYPLFPNPNDSAPPVATSTASTTAQTATTTKTAAASTTATARKEGFRDEVVSNHDVRVYRDQKGRSILLYGYWNPTTLLIARDPIAFAEILDRLATSRAQ